MKKLIFIVLLSLSASGQVIVGNYGVQYVASAPSGSCSSTSALTIVQSTGVIYTCQSGTWASVTGGGGGTPGGSNLQLQYNNSGAFGGTAGVTYDGSNGLGITGAINNGGNTAIGTSSSSNPLQVGNGANIYFQVIPPAGAYAGNIAIRPVGASGNSYILASSGSLSISGNTGSFVQIAYPNGAAGLNIQTSGSWVNGATFTGSTAGNAPSLVTAGSDTNINFSIGGKGTGFVIFAAPIKTAVYTVATLPTCNAALQGGRASVSDATAPSFLGTLTGGGSVVTSVLCNGSTWVAG
jgi:hypothetical protein